MSIKLKNKINNKLLLKLSKYLLLVYNAIIFFPIQLYPFSPGLDNSWIFSMNYQFNQGIGKYLAWTGGPFEFLIFPMAIGKNLEIAVIFQLTLWIIFIVALGSIFMDKNISLYSMILFTILFTLSANTSTETFCIYSSLILLCLCHFKEKWKLPYFIFLFYCVLFLFIKFTMAISLLAGSVVFILFNLFKNRNKAIHALIFTGTTVPLLFLITYLFYNPSIKGLIDYIKGSLEIVSGYSIAMSYSNEISPLIIVSIVLMVYAMIAIVLIKLKKDSFSIVVICFPFLFLAYKSYFVRHHINNTFFAGSIILAVIILFTKIGNNKEKYIFGFLTLFLMIFYSFGYSMIDTPNIISRQASAVSNFFNKSNKLINFSKTKTILRDKNQIKEYQIPQEWLEGIKGQKIGIFPYSLLFAAANQINYTPFPVFQAYSAYTSYLDNLNSAFIENDKKIHSWIIMNWKNLDGRHLLADVPAMWKSIYKWYKVERSINQKLLLKKIKPRFTQENSLYQKNYQLDEWIDVPDSKSPIIAKITMKLNVTGFLTKIMAKIPEVRMGLILNNGITTHIRIVPETLKNGLFINYLPLNPEDFEKLVSHDQSNYKILKFGIFGEGCINYNNSINIEFLTLPEIDIKVSTPGLSELTQLQSNTHYHLETINEKRFLPYKNDTVKIQKDENYLTIRGWAVDKIAQNCAHAVYADINGKIIPLFYNKVRKDIADYFKDPNYSDSGFEASIMKSQLKKGVNLLSIIIIAYDKKSYYSPGQKIQIFLE